MNELPHDPAILLSLLNMRLRDTDESLEDVCATLGAERDDVVARLAAAGFDYDEVSRRFC